MFEITTEDWIFLFLGLAVYFDATRHHIGHTKELTQFPNWTAGGWATAISFAWLGLIPLVVYFVHRKRLIEKAMLHPVRIGLPHRIGVALLLFILPMFIPQLLAKLAGLQ